MKVTFEKVLIPQSGVCVLLIDDRYNFSRISKIIDRKTSGKLSKIIKSEAFDGKLGQKLEVLYPGGVKLSKIIILGIGDQNKLDISSSEEIGGYIYKLIKNINDENASIIGDIKLNDKFSQSKFSAHLAMGIRLASYTFSKFKSKKNKIKKIKLKNKI